MMANDTGRSPDGSGFRPTDGAASVSAVPASIPNAATCEQSLQVGFLLDAAHYFENRNTGGEDRAHWSNVFNAKNCREIAAKLSLYERSLTSIVSWHADSRDVFPDWKTTADCLAQIADDALAGRWWMDAAQRIEAGTDETRNTAQPEGREPDGEADAPKRRSQ